MLPSRLLAALQLHDGLITATTAASVGLDANQVGTLVRRGLLVRVRHGVYTSAEHWASATTHPARELLRARAASLVMVEPHVLSHDSAAYALGLSFLRPEESWVHVTRPRVLGSRGRTGVKHHGAPYLPGQVVQTPYAPALDMARTACDLAREHGLRTGLTACDSALRAGVERHELEAAADAMQHWRGVSAVREAVALADPGAENPAESLARLIAVECGLGVARTQFPILLAGPLAGRVVWCDVLVGCHVIEMDGRMKYRRVEDGGVALRDAGEVVWAERQRERGILAAGFGVSRLVWDDLLPHRLPDTRERVGGEIRATHARLGTSLPPGAEEFAALMASERGRRLQGRPRSA